MKRENQIWSFPRRMVSKRKNEERSETSQGHRLARAGNYQPLCRHSVSRCMEERRSAVAKKWGKGRVNPELKMVRQKPKVRAEKKLRGKKPIEELEKRIAFLRVAKLGGRKLEKRSGKRSDYRGRRGSYREE